MIRPPLFTRSFFLFSGVLLLFIFMSFGFSMWLHSFEESQRVMKPLPPDHFTRDLIEASGEDPFKVVQRLQQDETQKTSPIRLDIIDATGKSLLTGQPVIQPALSAKEVASLNSGETIRPDESLHTVRAILSPLHNKPGKYLVTQFFWQQYRERLGKAMSNGPAEPGPEGRPAMGPPPPPPEGGGPGGPGPDLGPPPMGGIEAMREHHMHAGGPLPPPPRGLGPGGMPLMPIVSLIFFVLISVGVALYLFFSSYKKRAAAAMSVLESMKSGNLDARLPVGGLDELGPLVLAFNHMADEVQRLVESLKRADKARRGLLQDLAHDLRTPMASLRTFLETMESSGDRLSAERRREIFQLCLSEVDYFSRLVEDLLFMATITEPRYEAGADQVSVKDEIENQIAVFRERFPDLKFTLDCPEDLSVRLVGSQKLMNRLFRNAFANSCSFARGSIAVVIRNPAPGFVEVQIQDDGPGFTPEGLAGFGSKKVSRQILQENQQKRISLGIGSVIMREIAQIHGGSVTAQNLQHAGKVMGANVVITLGNSQI